MLQAGTGHWGDAQTDRRAPIPKSHSFFGPCTRPDDSVLLRHGAANGQISSACEPGRDGFRLARIGNAADSALNG